MSSSTDFPIGESQYALWVHPETMATYIYESNKRSWMSLANTGANVFTGTTDPAASGFSVQDGDLWWDANHLELRVYHKPLVAGETIIGHWVSSTNPQMSPQDTNRNRYIGTISLVAPQYDIYEDIQTNWDATLEGSTLVLPKDLDMVDIEWEVTPPSVPQLQSDGSIVDINVVIYDGDTLNAKIIWPEGTYLYQNGSQIGFNVFCRITAKPEFEDEFISTTSRSKSTVVYPKVSKNNSFDTSRTFAATETLNTLGGPLIGLDTNSNVEQSGDIFKIKDILGLHTRFFVEDKLTSVDSTLAPMIFSLVEDSNNPAEVVSSGYTVLTGEYFTDDDVTREGYIIDIAGLDTTTPLQIFMKSSYDQTLKGTILLTI